MQMMCNALIDSGGTYAMFGSDLHNVSILLGHAIEWQQVHNAQWLTM
jgi:hypothetical protein